MHFQFAAKRHLRGSGADLRWASCYNFFGDNNLEGGGGAVPPPPYPRAGRPERAHSLHHRVERDQLQARSYLCKMHTLQKSSNSACLPACLSVQSLSSIAGCQDSQRKAVPDFFCLFVCWGVAPEPWPKRRRSYILVTTTDPGRQNEEEEEEKKDILQSSC